MRKQYNLSFRREQQKKERTRRIIAIIIILFVFAALGTLIYFAVTNVDWDSVLKSNDKAQVAKEEESKTVELSISCVGDIMAHSPQLESAKDGDTYNFDDSFEYIKSYIEDADLALANLETTFGDKPYKGYPTFSSPDEFATAIKKAGFDVALTSNNHMLDTGTDGLKRTIEVLDDTGLEHTGSVANKQDKDYLVTDVKGVKVGIVSYTYETSYSTTNRTLNGSRLDDDDRQLINSYSPRNMEEDIDDIKASVDGAKEDGAEVIVMYFHWGDEYDSTSNEREQEMAEAAAEMGADVIFASHPHVLQEFDTIKTDDGKEVPVFYSMGNFLSNQRQDTVGKSQAEQGMIAQVKLVYDKTKGEIKTLESSYIPTWVNKYYSKEEKKNLFIIIPLVDGFEENPTIEEANKASRAEDMLEAIKDVLGDPDKPGKDEDKEDSDGEN